MRSIAGMTSMDPSCGLSGRGARYQIARSGWRDNRAGVARASPPGSDVDEPLEEREADLLALLGVELDREEVVPRERGAVRDPVRRGERDAGRGRGRRVGVGEVRVG